MRALPFLLLAACLGCAPDQNSVEGVAPRSLLSSAGPGEFRVMSFNIEWLTENAPQQRTEKLRRIISEAGPSIIGFQEIESRRALTRWLDPSYTVWMLDSGEDQELALAVKAPFRLVKAEMAFPKREDNDFFPRQRDALRARLATADGAEITVYVVHLKSRGPEGRKSTDFRRVGAAKKLVEDIRRQSTPVVVLGDFNDTPGDESLNTLESAPLVNLAQAFYENDGVTVDLDTMDWRSLTEPRVPGAMRENERFRGKEYDFRSDVKIKPALFDQILASPSLVGPSGGGFAATNPRLVLDGASPRISSGRVVMEGTRASDHLPVTATLKLP